MMISLIQRSFYVNECSAKLLKIVSNTWPHVNAGYKMKMYELFYQLVALSSTNE